MLKPVMVSGFQPGGQLMITTDVENYPGFADVIQGPWLMEQMRLQAEHVGTRSISDHIVKVELGHRPFRLTGDSGDTYSCDALIISTGAQAKWLGLPSEARFQGFGVSACATCDGFFFRGKEVVVVGGGNTAVEEALYLANLAAKVTVVHRRGSFRAERILQDRLFKHPKIEVVWDSAVEEICGSEAPPSSRICACATCARVDSELRPTACLSRSGTSRDRTVRRPARHEARRLPPDPARLDRDQHSRRLRGRRRHRRRLPPGRDSGRHGLYGSVGS
jgi:thioredoxin reductase